MNAFMSADYTRVTVEDEKRFIEKESMVLVPLGAIPIINRAGCIVWGDVVRFRCSVFRAKNEVEC
jgi:hypothetical protein